MLTKLIQWENTLYVDIKNNLKHEEFHKRKSYWNVY